MPSISITEGYTVTNWGPSTTTFTAPASCATATGNYMIGLNTTAPVWEYAIQCSTSGYDDCIPSISLTWPVLSFWMGLQRELQYAMPTTLYHNGGIGTEFFILRKGYIKIYRESFDQSSPFLEDVNGVNLVHIVNETQVLTEEQVHSPKDADQSTCYAQI
ncbi:hypothetical protein PEBR_02546 [Penicillium brasilianum]|uniref:Cyclic nucleotide-binding domain-containing protein n=1 Tax=Penicillium brasilianum TaxID=104259 RepID=A0A1S9RZ65_PENBI|nr:hypothetical protein PEBR_02546 [Penicillium brasilianum]